MNGFWGVAIKRAPWALVAVGVTGLAIAALLRPDQAGAAAGQDWPPFILVTGLLLIGFVADEDGLFEAAGHALARMATNGLLFFVGTTVLVATVTALLNLDTAVAFLTPVLIYAARRRGQGEVALLYGCVLLANAGSLLLPGSNLTNLIVLGHLHLSGAQFFRRMALAWLVSVAITSLVVGVADRRSLRAPATEVTEGHRPALGIGLISVMAATAAVVVLRQPALAVLAIGLVSLGWRARAVKGRGHDVYAVLSLPILVGLFATAVALGTLGRAWSGPSDAFSHLDMWTTAFAAAGSTVVVNNLPAASLLAAKVPAHPLALLVGLNVGPNLSVTGSLAWVLWYRSARNAGATPRIAQALKLGLIAAPLAIACAVWTLTLNGGH
jgi:arsenical pump membrane protein